MSKTNFHTEFQLQLCSVPEIYNLPPPPHSTYGLAVYVTKPFKFDNILNFIY